MYHQSFTVSGRGQFPIDMLRYDTCFPVNPESVSVIYDCCSNHDLNALHNTEPVKVRLARYVDSKVTQPTIDRWRSFGWNVLDISTSKM